MAALVAAVLLVGVREPRVAGSSTAAPEADATAVFHVAPGGDRGASGTAQHPLASLSEALERAAEATGPVEIVLHAGVYEGGVRIEEPPRRGGATLPRLTIRAASTPSGGYEAVVFEGGRRVESAVAVDASQGIYEMAVPGVVFGRQVQLWEADTGVRYTLVADRAAVRRYANSFWYAQPRGSKGEVTLFLHTSDGAPPSAHALWRSERDVGLLVRRPDVTLRGLGFRDFLARESGAIVSLAPRTVVEDVRISNSLRGVAFGRGGDDGAVQDCWATDVMGGVYVAANGITVSGCRLERAREFTLLPGIDQNNTGIQFYYPSVGGTVRGNLATGFENGLLIKTTPSRFAVAGNTFVGGPGNRGRGMGPNHWDLSSSYTRNVVADFHVPVWALESVPPTTETRENCIAPPLDGRRSPALSRFGTVAQPVFVDTTRRDFRLVHGSPCADLASGNVGAFGVAPPGVLPAGLPPVRLALAPPAVPARPPSHTARPGDTEGSTERGLWLAPEARVTLLLEVEGDFDRITGMRLRLGDHPWTGTEPARRRLTVDLPASTDAVPVRVSLRDARGSWHDLAPLPVIAGASPPRLLGEPWARVTRTGFVARVEVDRPCAARLEYGSTPELGEAMPAHQEQQRLPEAHAGGSSPVVQSAWLLPPRVAPGQRYHWRLVLRDALGRRTVAGSGSFALGGEPRTFYVSPDGRDAAERGSQDAPLRSIQYAVDRALPGDRVLLLPGLYTEPAQIERGGIADAPLTIAAAKPGTAVLDGRRSASVLIRLEEAPYAVIEGLELRWFRKAAIELEGSSHVRIRHNRIWNDFWFGWIAGIGIRAFRSPDLEIEGNIVYKTGTAIWLKSSPGATIVHNTTLGNMGGAVVLNQSVAGTTIHDNSFAFEGLQVLVLGVDEPGDLATFSSDWNNLGLNFRKPLPTELDVIRTDRRQLEAESRVLRRGSKWLVNLSGVRVDDLPGGHKRSQWKIREASRTDLRFYSFRDWRGATGQDRHSIFADPRYVDPEAGDFRLEPGSPNLGAGSNGGTIGALGAVQR